VAGDYAAIGELFGDESVWETNNVAPGHRDARGRRAIIEGFLQPVRDRLFEPGDPKVEVVRTLSAGDWVAAAGRRPGGNRRNHPRAVVYGTSSPAAAGRTPPAPPATPASTIPIASAASRRQASTNAGSSARVTRQPRGAAAARRSAGTGRTP